MQAISAQCAAVSMGYTASHLLSNLIAAICHLIMVYYFINVLDWGFDGVAIATSILFVIRFLVGQAYLCTVKPLQEVHDVSFCSKETFENLGYQFKLGIG